MIARSYNNLPDPYQRRRAPIVISAVGDEDVRGAANDNPANGFKAVAEDGTGVAVLRKTLVARYRVRIADNDLDGYRW